FMLPYPPSLLLFFFSIPRPPTSTLFPYTTLFRSELPQHMAHAAFVPITQCPISAELLWKATEAFLAEVNRRSIMWLERAPFSLEDRKSTRLNSSHRTISYAVFCLKKKKKKNIQQD